MAENNKSYRIRTKVGREADTFLNVHLEQDYDSLEILSLKISDKDTYKLHNSDYGVVVGRVLANGNFGVPNAKISVFIPSTEQNSSMEMWNLYPYTTTSTKNDDNIRYNLLPDESVKDCHKAVGTFPNKTFLLDNDATIEVFDKYYVYTTRTNAAGDYLICGVPTGMQTLHMDLDLSDCGILSQRPRDFVYKGYTIEQFENPNQFKKDENIDGLSQIFSQNHPVYVQPFWGNSDNGEEIGITRADIEIAFKFEPTCVFMGSAISDNASNGVGKKCVPTNQMGAMDELTAGEGTIEMIRKTPAGNVEEFSIKGNQLINGNGVWCYQIPMNLDYMMTDEYGNMVPTDDPDKGIPTRTRVRFRASLTDMENSSQSYFRAKYLIPNNPNIEDTDPDYNFGTYTDESSYRDLFWNGVYTVKSYIPRFQKSKRWNNERFSGIKACNYYAGNNPMPYNNMRIKIPFMFAVLCIFVKLFIKIVTIVNRIQFVIWRILFQIVVTDARGNARQSGAHCVYLGDGLCPDMEGWYYAPACMEGTFKPVLKARQDAWKELKEIIFGNTLAAAVGNGDAPGIESRDDIKSTQYTDETAIDSQNKTDDEEESVCLTRNIDYLLNCFEMNLAQEYRVIKFDFYNDWVNGVIYFPRWMRKIKRKKRYKFSLRNGITAYYKDKVQGCMNSSTSNVRKTRYYTQQCSLSYTGTANNPWTTVTTPISCNKNKKVLNGSTPSKCHKKKGMMQSSIFGKKSGLVTEEMTMLGEYVYYLKPCEWKDTGNGKKRTLLFATDIVLLGTLNDCDENGLPQSFKYLNNTSYVMPTNLALTTMDDDPYIYSDSVGTVCYSGHKIKGAFREENFIGSATRITPNYESTSKAYEKTADDKITYIENDDPIAVTEAAGIVWNYAGPGQDDVNAGSKETPTDFIKRMFSKTTTKTAHDYLYYPGGHFLGLSCSRSDTNIKSCVNLKRICELGATMSQRREELRGYTEDPQTHTVKPEYRYYVPTGLISNVDIEGAAFRSMFATMNHNKLIATRTNEKTGYKFYEFMFLRPDGFDGSLAKYIYQGDSPYNRKVNHNGVKAATDDSEFMRNSPLWSTPEDYDPQETAFTETRTVEDSIVDYYMFRFGLDNLSTKEQKKHYLYKDSNGYSLPQYENSFYFYFGLKDGATALDEFKKQFFSECEANVVMKEPNVNIEEKIDENLSGTATIIINNMVGPYTVTLKDETLGNDYAWTAVTESDTIDFSEIEPGLQPIIGHKYTVTVTDSIDNTVTRTIIYGDDVVDIDVDITHFRYNRSSSSHSKSDLKYGGYIKIGDTVRILSDTYSLSDPGNPLSFKYGKTGQTSQLINLYENDSYVDANGDKQHIFKIDNVGNYDIYANYNGTDIMVYTLSIEDNSNVELCIGCDYLGYKSGAALSGITEQQWLNDPTIFGADTLKPWLLRHTCYRQTEDDTLGFDSAIYSNTNDADVVVFGWPEKGGLTNGADVKRETHEKNDYKGYEGYSLDDTWSFIPTMYWSAGTMQNVSGRNPFDAMAYTSDGRAAADSTEIIVTGMTVDPTNSNNLLVYCSGQATRGIAVGHGCLIALESDVILTPVVTGITDRQIEMICYNTENPYENVTDSEQLTKLLSMASVYPTMSVPVMYKPFFGDITAATWNLATVGIGTDDKNESVTTRGYLPFSHKVEGTIHNGLTYGGKFYSGDSSEAYETYLVDNSNDNFWKGLNVDTREDYKYDRNFKFGENNSGSSFCREISAYTPEINDVNDISYSIAEGFPVISTSDTNYSKIYSGDYVEGFNYETLSDSCNISTVFHNNLCVFAFSDSGISGPSCLIANSIPDTEETSIWITREQLFDDSGRPLATSWYSLEIGDISITLVSGFYGTYNEKATYDIKGGAVTVISGAFGRGEYIYPKTDSSGIKKSFTATTESDLKDEGVTLLHEYTLKRRYKSNLSEIENLLSRATEITVGMVENGTPTGTPRENYTLFDNSGEPGFFLSECGTIIEKYVRPADSGRNQMTVYKLYPIGQLEVKYPPRELPGEQTGE